MLKRIASVCTVVLATSACSDGALVRPLDDSLPLQPPSFALVDAARGEGGAEGFYFLPPLAKSTTVEGDFDPNLLPSMQVCELTGNPSEFANPLGWAGVGCVAGAPAVSFRAGSATVDGSSYQFSWKTGAPLDADKFYRIQILLDTLVLGFLDVNPQEPSGQTPGEDYPDLYAFRLGETIPVKFFLSPQARCYGAEGYVIQCTATAVVDQNGGTVSLEPELPGWPKLSVVIPAGSLPGIPQVTVTLERIDPVQFADMTGEECIPAFDAPQFSDCLRVTTDPELPAELLYPALIEMCIDPFALVGITEAQAERIQIIRFDDSGTGAIQGLPMTEATSCPDFGDPSSTAQGLLPVPEGGLLRLAALGVNGLARLLGPEALAATRGEIRLAGTTSNFSRFRWALPGEMVKVAGDNVVIQEPETGAADYTIPVTVQVVDTGGVAVAGARVRFSSGANPTFGYSDTEGFVHTSWTVSPGAGTKTLDAFALGLLNDKVPGNQNLIEFTEKTVTFTATVVGAPSRSTQTPAATPALTGAPGATIPTPLVITVLDENGNPVSGWDVEWETTCQTAGCTPGTLDGDAQTGSDGTASATWTLSSAAGGNTATATVGGVTATWYANGVCQVVVNGVMSASEWTCGQKASFTANISGGSTPAEVYWQNDGINLYMAVRVQQSALSRVSSLRVDFDNDGLGVHNEGDDAIGYDAGTASFFDQYLTRKCANSGQSGCGETDPTSRDGAGAVGNDGTWTVYELSHPLKGTAGEDFIRSAGEKLGFFLTLRVGSGAQGNTQWPGFRSFRFITIQ